MSRRALLVIAASFVALPAACAHTRDTEPAVEAQSPAAPARHRPVEPAHAAPPGASPPHDRPGDGATPAPLASSPAGLLKPGAAKRIQDRLAEKGFLSGDHLADSLDSATREALRRFQHESDLPATGAPDDATVRKLGLPPDDVFKRAE